MRALIGLLLLGMAGVCQAGGIGYDAARHLLNRAGFAASEAEVQAFAALDRDQAVDKLFAAVRTEAQTPPPAWVNEELSVPGQSPEQRRAFAQLQQQRKRELRMWWWQEMLSTPSPLTERMTLFWHNHFVSGQPKTFSPLLLYRQNVLLRRYALGNFGELLHAVAKDPAMMVYLDTAFNRKSSPNENFARELMELFTLGIGNYTEQDVKEVARAFTGWGLDPETRQFHFYPQQHDAGVKIVLGQSGNFDGDAVLDILLARPQTAQLITAKLWREFISPVPDIAEVNRLANLFRQHRYDIKTLLRGLLTSNAFYDLRNRATLVKSPVILIVGSLRQFDIHPAELQSLLQFSRGLGQDVFAPPNVKGWPGGDLWINSSTLLQRKQFLTRLMDYRGGGSMAQQYFDAARWLGQFQGSEVDRRAHISRLLLAAKPVGQYESATDEQFIRDLTLDPVYQLQ